MARTVKCDDGRHHAATLVMAVQAWHGGTTYGNVPPERVARSSQARLRGVLARDGV